MSMTSNHDDGSAFLSSGSSADSISDPTTSLSIQPESPPPSKRRKTSHDEGKTTFPSSFSIRPHPSSPPSEALSIVPITLLPRPRLPLSWLDPCAGSTELPPGQLFVANTPSLENGLRRHDHPVVLAVRLALTGGLYVIERVRRGVYALCALGDWVSDANLLVASKGWPDPPTRASRGGKLDTAPENKKVDWREVAKVPDHGFDMEITRTKPKKRVSVVFRPGEKMGRVSAPDEATTTTTTHDIAGETGMSEAGGDAGLYNSINGANVGVSTLPEVQAEAAPQTPAQILEGLRSQYLEALYVSKTSVAYFAKGPLSRTRAALQQLSGEEHSIQSPEVISFYRDSILPMKKMDVKYRETLPSTIQSLPLTMSDEENAKPVKKKRSKKKNKLGRNGLYTEEKHFIGIWWRNRHHSETSVPIESSRDAEMKQFIADLRLREMQLQILWILETISVEAASAQGGSTNADTVESQGIKKTKAKKSQDLNVLLELLLDRLCIWHTVSFEESLSTDMAKGRDKNNPSGAKVENDKLRDFCTEVIIPFYASRLPAQCSVINRKLGGRSANSPARPKRPQSKRTSQVQPGAAIERRQPSNPRRTLQRVLTDEKATARSRSPSLLRSNTAPVIPELQREPSESSSFPTNSSFRGAIQKPRRVDNREVDLNATAKIHEAKLKRMNKLMEQKRELDTAINRLRKPNRELVAKDYVESVPTSNSRKSKNPVRNPYGQGVQVMATPKRARKKDVAVGSTPQSRARRPQFGRQVSSPADIREVQVVPSSTVRPGYRSATASNEGSRPNFSLGAQSQPAEVSRIDSTPSRGPSKQSNPLSAMVDDEDASSRSSHIKNNLFKVPNVPARSVSAVSHSTPTSSRRMSLQSTLRNDGSDTAGDPFSVQETPPRLAVVVPAKRAQALTTPTKRPLSAPKLDAQRSLAAPSTPGSPGSNSLTTKKPRLNKQSSSSHGVVDGKPQHSSPREEDSVYRSLGWDDEDDELSMI